MSNSEELTKAFELVPERKLSSLYDIAVLYSACDLYSKLTSDAAPAGIRGTSLQAMTPQSKSNLYGEANSLISVMVDLSGSEPQLGSPPVTFETYERGDRYKIAHMMRDGKSGKKMDYGVTNHANGKDVEDIAYDSYGERFLTGRLSRWPFTDEAVEYVEGGDDSNGVISGLQSLGEDDHTLAKLQRYVYDSAPFDSTEALVTVRVKLEQDGDYLYPGEVDALNDVGVERRYNHIRDGLSVSDANGDGVGYVTGDNQLVLGGSPGINGQFGKKSRERFPSFEANDSWKTRPLTEPTAIAISDFNSLSDSFYQSVNSLRCYYLPYPTSPMTLDVFEKFYDTVYEPLATAGDDEFLSELREVLFDIGGETDISVGWGDDSWLSVYGLFHNSGSDPSRTLLDIPNVSLDSVVKLHNEYTSSRNYWERHSTLGSHVKSDNYYLPSGPVFDSVLNGSFFFDVSSPIRDPADEFSNGDSNDPLLTSTGEFLSGRPINSERLLEDYLNRIILEQRKDSYHPLDLCDLLVAQLVQLEALSHAGLLKNTSLFNRAKQRSTHMAETDNNSQSRENALEDFLNTHEVLSTPAARSTFLVGGLVARVSAWQQRENIAQTLVDDFPVSAISARNIREVVNRAVEKDEMYKSASDGGGPNNSRYTSRLPDAMLEQDPDEWDMSTAKLQWCYALGIAYGRSDTSNYDGDDDSTNGEN